MVFLLIIIMQTQDYTDYVLDMHLDDREIIDDEAEVNDSDFDHYNENIQDDDDNLLDLDTDE